MSQPHRTAETRDDVMNAPDLHVLLCQRTAEDYRSDWEKSHLHPPVAGIIIAGLLGFAFQHFDHTRTALIFLILAGLQIVWAVATMVIRVFTAVDQTQDSIRTGRFPPEAAPLVFKRLKWWNHLVAPKNWARHSRIHERKYQLEEKIQKISDHLRELQSEEEETRNFLENLPKDQILTLAARITNFAEREKVEAKAHEIKEEIPQLKEELTLYYALYHKVQEITDKLDRMEALGFVGREDPDNIHTFVHDAIEMLEARRRLVRDVDSIDPDEFLELVKVL